ncbi:hypothetical protein NFI96_031418 [Prochilodus magdalenae]|nr:hypothetical protein NFI96_031418 [Prochilodus magdalenae]
MYARVCSFSPDRMENPRAAEAAPFHARMTKRRAEAVSPFCAVPEKKRCRSVCSADSPPASPPPVLQHISLSDSPPRCRKRPSRPDPLESIPDPKKAPAARAPSRHISAKESSGKFGDASRASPAKLQTKRPREEENQLEVKEIRRNQDGASEDELCAFNSFQFWRPPLPELDLSLLDEQVSGGATSSDSTEAMET